MAVFAYVREKRGVAGVALDLPVDKAEQKCRVVQPPAVEVLTINRNMPTVLQ